MRKPLVVHPLLFALFPVLFLYATNISEMRANQTLMPLALSLGATLVLWVLFSLLFKDRVKASLAASILVLLFFTYGHFYSLLEKWDIFVPGHGYLLPVLLLAFGYGVYFIGRARRDFKLTTGVMNIVAAVLVVLNAFTVVAHQVGITRVPPPEMGPPESTSSIEPSSKPDIYFIVLDEYAGPDTMKEIYGYDDSEFINSLKNKGFFVASGSQMHNRTTVRAIASVLNMEQTREDEPVEVTYQRITNNAVVNFVRSQGYKYIYFGQWYEEGRYQIQADTYFNYYKKIESGLSTSQFSATLWNTTMLRPFYNYLFGEQFEGYYREGLTLTLDQLMTVPEMEGPKFVYAHILSPHAPFVFGPDGERVAPANFYNVDDKQYYLGQYTYISREIDKVIDKILADSKTDPIIIVQSDHGPRWTAEWEKILNAYHLPGNGNDLLNDSISPINSFRIIFDHYFNAGLDIPEGTDG